MARVGRSPPAALLGEITHGTRILLRNASIRQALVLAVAEALAGACAIVVTITYVRDLLHGTELQYSLVMAAAGAGSALTAFILSRVTGGMEESEADAANRHGIRHRWASRSMLAGGLILAGSLLPAALAPGLLVFAALWMLNGAGQALVAIPSSTLVASHTRTGERGRAFAAHFAITHACWLITYPLTGRVAEQLGPAKTFLICGLACLGVAVVGVAMGNPVEASHVHPAIDE